MLAHNSVDRGPMARDSIELNLDDSTLFAGKSSRARNINTQPSEPGTQHSAFSTQPEEGNHSRRSIAVRSERMKRIDRDDSELIVNREDLELDELENEEAQFLRTERRVPVRRSPIPKKAAGRLKIAAVVAAVLVVCGGLYAGGKNYVMHAPLFTIASSDSVELTGVRNASRAQVMDIAAKDLGRNIFYVPLEERKAQLEQISWVESASVMRLLPNRIAVTIQERAPVAFVHIGSRISLIDANGVVMGMPANRQIKYSFPVIRGITETEPLSSRAAAMKIYNRLVSELDSAEDAGANGAAGYVKQLSEVDLSDPEDVKVTANDPGGTMVVHLGGRDFSGLYRLYVAHIAEWRQQYPNLQSVDLRYEGQVVVNPDQPNVAPKAPGAEKSLSRINADRKKAVARPVSQTVSTKRVVHHEVEKKAGFAGAKARQIPKYGTARLKPVP